MKKKVKDAGAGNKKKVKLAKAIAEKKAKIAKLEKLAKAKEEKKAKILKIKEEKKIKLEKLAKAKADKQAKLEKTRHEKKIKIGKEKAIDIRPKEKFNSLFKTGIKGFDELFEKGEGIPSGSAVLIEGGPGSGKTIFCLATAMNLCKQGKKCLYMSFEEPEEKLIRHMKKFNWNFDEYLKKDMLRIKRFDAIDVARSIEALLSAAKKELLIEVNPIFFPEDFNPDFVVMDSLTSIASAFSGEESRFRIYMEQLFRYLEKNKITNFLIREVSSPSHVGSIFKEKGEAVSFLSDGIIVLYNVIYPAGTRGLALEILKMRGTSFKKRIVEMKIINGRGLEINPDKILKKEAGAFDLT